MKGRACGRWRIEVGGKAKDDGRGTRDEKKLRRAEAKVKGKRRKDKG